MEMERRSWLWRRRSSAKGGAEIESSASNSSERLSDDHDVAERPSPETTSDLTTCEDHENTIKMLTRKLADALSKIHAREGLVKQHIRVAEEAVSGNGSYTTYQDASSTHASLDYPSSIAVKKIMFGWKD